MSGTSLVVAALVLGLVVGGSIVGASRMIQNSLETGTKELAAVRAALGDLKEAVGSARDVSWESLGPFVCGAIEGRATTVLADDWSGYWPSAAVNVDHEPIVHGNGSRAAEVLP